MKRSLLHRFPNMHSLPARLIVVAGIAAGSGGLAAAQTAAKPAPTGSTRAAVGIGGAPVEVEANDELSLTSEQMRARGAAAVTAIDSARSSLASMVAAAKDSRDVVKVLCLDDKSSQVGIALKTAIDREASLRAATDAQSEERARHEFTLLMVLKERVDVLISEANQCIGEETGFTGESELTVEVDPNQPEVQAETVSIAPATVVEPPEVSSPS